MRFRATIQLTGKTATGIEVPEDLVAALGPSKRPAVSVALGEYAYRTSVAARGDRFLLPVSAEVREKAGVAAGDEVDVDIELDAAPREVTVPADLAEALESDPKARRFFDGLSYSQKQGYVIPIEAAKTPATRERRIAKAIAMLREERKR